VAVSVRDTGIGIPPESLASIFDMFSQVDRTIERSTGGLGIGLALVKGLVEMHGGTVKAESGGPGKGSTFTVTLPVLAHRSEHDAEATDSGQASAGSARRVLVVDDNRDGAESLALMLRLLGNEVRTANDGVAAVGLAESFAGGRVRRPPGQARQPARPRKAARRTAASQRRQVGGLLRRTPLTAELRDKGRRRQGAAGSKPLERVFEMSAPRKLAMRVLI
jgi:CheY-like chemotaxis protein